MATNERQAKAVADAVSKIASGAAYRQTCDPLAREISDMEREGHAEIVAALSEQERADMDEAIETVEAEACRFANGLMPVDSKEEQDLVVDSIDALSDRLRALRDRLTTTTPSAPRQEEALRDALAANERDRSSVAQFINRLQSVMNGWSWVREGRGPYEWNDDGYRKEFGRCMDAIQRCVDYWTEATHAHDLSNCPTTQAEVIAARTADLGSASEAPHE